MDNSFDTSFSVVDDMPLDVYLGTPSDLSTDDDLPDTGIDEQYLRNVHYYDSKNAYLRGNPQFRELDTDSFLHLLFCRGDDCELLPFEEDWCEAYEWYVNSTEAERKNRPPELPYVYNGIAQAIYGKRKEQKNKTFVLTSSGKCIQEILSHPFVIMSPVSYTGKRRTKTNARYLYAIAIDIDDVDGDNVENLFYQSDPLRPHITFPQPQIIVNSGGGIHIYFLLESPAPMFDDSYKIWNKIKKELIRRVWNKGTTHKDPKHPQLQGNCQGFRVPGTQTKTRKTVTAFQNLNPHCKPYYTISDLTFGGGGFLTPEEEKLLKKGTYDPHRVSLDRARQLYPEWYERRIVLKMPPGRWYVNRGLYDWWKEQIFLHASVGHRYFCLMTLAIFAKKCKQITYEQFKAVYAERLKGLSERQILNRFKRKRGVTEEEFKKDLMDFVAVLDGLSVSKREEDRFTIDDALDAAAAYQESYCTFPMEDLRDITGVEIKKNQRRKNKIQEVHLMEARAVRDSHDEMRGHSWDIGRGRKRKQVIVCQWRQENPNGTMYACAKDLGIDYHTAKRWWNCTVEDAKAEFDRLNAIQKAGLAAINAKKSVEEYEIPDMQPELHDMGAEVNYGYITDRKIAAATLQNTEGYEAQDAATIHKTGDELTDAINFGALNVEELMRSMGVPDFMIPMMKAEIERKMQTPEFWEEYHKANPNVDTSLWPPQFRRALDKAVEEHKNKK